MRGAMVHQSLLGWQAVLQERAHRSTEPCACTPRRVWHDNTPHSMVVWTHRADLRKLSQSMVVNHYAHNVSSHGSDCTALC
jgi:hypothetical protein